MRDRQTMSPAARAFLHYMRTGQRLSTAQIEDDARLERKFNPYHDPENGQFTFAPGGPRSLPHVITSRRKEQGSARPAPQSPPSTAPARRTDGMSAISLSRTHRAFLAEAKRFPAKPGTQDKWTGEGSKEAFKNQYIAGHSNVIRAAARRYDLPAPLVAAVAYRELGSDDAWNDVAYAARAERGRDIPLALGMVKRGREFIDDLNRPRDETSFGPYNIQQRRAVEILDYDDVNKMSETARRMLVPTTRNPVPATFMLAKHLSDLRDQDFRGVAGKDLTADQLVIIAARYNQGPEKSLAEMNDPKRKKHGYDYLINWRHVTNLLQ